MKESRIEATDRLRRENRWGEASQYRDEVRQRLRSEGKSRQEASDEAWGAMLEQFPPLPAPTAALTNALDLADADDATLDRLATVAVDWPRDIRWVYANFSHPRPKLQSVPSLAAWGLLAFARSEPAKFFGQLLPPALATANGNRQDAEPEADTDPGLADLDRMLGDDR